MDVRWRIRLCSSCVAIGCALLAGLVAAGESRAGKFKTPDVFLLGDSQFAFGAGPTFHDFFRNFADNCSGYGGDKWLAQYGDLLDVGVMGVRSTSIHSWVARNWNLKKFVCQPDPKWNVNARLYGWMNRANGTYVQLGRAPDFKICQPNRSALEVMFADPMNRPKLMVWFFTGNSVHRWANGRKQTRRDMQRLVAQLPREVACIIMTTVPTYRLKDNRLRLRAQIGIRRAIAETGSRCQFIPGYTVSSLKAFQGNRRYYRRYASGKVKDPYHPNEAGARAFLDLQRKALCTAAIKALRPMATAARKRTIEAAADLGKVGLPAPVRK